MAAGSFRARLLFVAIGAGACSAHDDHGGAAQAGGNAGSAGLPGAGGSAGTVANGGNNQTGGLAGTGAGTPAGGAPQGGTTSSGGAPGGTTSTGGVATGGAGAGGAAGMGGTADQCPPAPAMATPAQVTALAEVNRLRLAVGSGCATEVAGANGSATAHCAYYAGNMANMMCIADPHAEVMSCMGFTGASFGARMKAAGYAGQGAFEVMAFSNDPVKAVAQWVNSIWHRIPILDPWVTELGYGAAARCDTIDFGAGKPMPNTTVVVYPYDGQTGLPTSFDGSREGPMPPAPSTGWPSGYPVTLYGKMLTITEHTLTVDGETTPIDHVFLTAADSSFLRDSVMLYANMPLTAATKYHVKITGTGTAGAVSREWSFTTK